jgi:ribulose-phosphate 3-epimerase
MAEIIPAIVEADFQEIRKKIGRVDGLTDWVQIDIADGLFATNFTWENWGDLNELDGRAKVEVHLMVEQPEHYVTDWLKVADRIIVHLESTDKLPWILQQFDPPAGGHRVQRIGLALLLETPLDQLKGLGDKIDLIQLMSIEKIGRHGESFDERALERVKALRAQLPGCTISVDGGINLDNGKRLVEAGANNLVIGSEIWNSKDVKKTILEFQKL